MPWCPFFSILFRLPSYFSIPSSDSIGVSPSTLPIRTGCSNQLIIDGNAIPYVQFCSIVRRDGHRLVTGSPPNDPNAGSVQTVRCKVLSASPFFPSQPHPAGCPHWHQNAAILASPWHDDLARSCKHKSFLVRPGLKLHCM